MDYYTAVLVLVAFSGPVGTVEVWETRGSQLAEIHIGTSVGQVRFVNSHGDLLACLGGSICIISSLHYLPVRALKKVLHLDPSMISLKTLQSPSCFSSLASHN